MVSDLGEQKFFESWYPGTLVDSMGDLYAIRNDTGGWGGPGWYINRISSNSSNGISSSWDGFGIDAIDSRYRQSNYFSLSGDSAETTLFKNQSWHILQPCIAQEVNGTTDYLYIFVFAPPSRWTGSSNDCEGIGWAKILKSKLNRTGGHIISTKLFPGRANGTDVYPDMKTNVFRALDSNYNLNSFTAIHDVGAGRTTLYWSTASDGWKLNRLHLNDAGGDVHSGVNHSITNCTIGTSHVKWRILKGNNVYYFLGGNAIDPRLFKATALQTGDVLKGDTIEMSSLPLTWHSLVEPGYATKDYYSDLGIVKASDGTEIPVMLYMAKGSYLTALDSRWNTNYVTWNLNYIVLGLASRVGSTWKSPPENCLAMFPVTTATVGEATSASTLYKNTHMFVVCGEYIIYAYCYPGGGKGLVLGVAHYALDSNKYVHLLTKREFVDSSGNSFGNLTECTRIISMDAKNGHLWITFVKGTSTWCHFHAFVDDIIKHAAS
jgi:hypothetical protein